MFLLFDTKNKNRTSQIGINVVFYMIGIERQRPTARKQPGVQAKEDQEAMDESLQELMQASWGKMTLEKLLYGLLLAVVCLVVVRLVLTLVRRLTARTSLDERIKKYILSGTKTLLYILTALIVAASLGIDVTSLIALVSVFGLAVSLAVQDVLSNVAGGLVLLFSKPFTLGDYVETVDGEGTVAEISLTHTKLDTFGGQRVMLPNSKLVAGKIVNYTSRGVRRVDHEISASYDDSAQAVRSACLKAVARTPGVLEDPPPAVVVTGYGESSISYHVRCWARTEDFWDVNNTSLEEIRRAFEEDGVTMTYNHLNVHIVDSDTRKEK